MENKLSKSLWFDGLIIGNPIIILYLVYKGVDSLYDWIKVGIVFGIFVYAVIDRIKNNLKNK